MGEKQTLGPDDPAAWQPGGAMQTSAVGTTPPGLSVGRTRRDERVLPDLQVPAWQCRYLGDSTDPHGQTISTGNRRSFIVFIISGSKPGMLDEQVE